MNNEYTKYRSYIKQRLEYVTPVDYIIELENKIDVLEEENEILKNREKEAVEHYNTAIKYSHEIEDKYIDYKSRCEKAVDEIQQLIDDVNNKTIIGLNNFVPKLEEIQDKLANGGGEE